jgi:hypothetical protein
MLFLLHEKEKFEKIVLIWNDGSKMALVLRTRGGRGKL